MPFYRNHIYPHLVNKLGDPKPYREIRRRIIPLAHGNVLEIGVGPGVNFAHYDPANVTKIFALEPNPGMVRLAEKQQAKTKLDVEFLQLPCERIPLRDSSIDTVVSTFTLCTISSVSEALADVSRVLKPDGQFIFLEHGCSPDSEVRRWQKRCEPLGQWLFEGCRLTRDVPSLLARSGFQVQQIEANYLADFPKTWTYCWWGTSSPK